MFLLPIGDAPNYAGRRPWVTWTLIALNIGVFFHGRFGSGLGHHAFLLEWPLEE